MDTDAPAIQWNPRFAHGKRIREGARIITGALRVPFDLQGKPHAYMEELFRYALWPPVKAGQKRDTREFIYTADNEWLHFRIIDS
jgi:hypothetical protein